jgi:hypothetical protein
MKLELKKIYYYIISLIAFLILMWGAVDLASAATDMTLGRFSRPVPATYKGTDSGLEEYYQTRVAQDRISDSLSRILVAGIVFFYNRRKVNAMEEK